MVITVEPYHLFILLIPFILGVVVSTVIDRIGNWLSRKNSSTYNKEDIMITAKQARSKQATIHWRDNETLVEAYDIEKKRILREIEEKINTEITGNGQKIKYSLHGQDLNYIYEVTKTDAEYGLARKDLIQEILDELESLGYMVTIMTGQHSIFEWLEISWEEE